MKKRRVGIITILLFTLILSACSMQTASPASSKSQEIPEMSEDYFGTWTMILAEGFCKDEDGKDITSFTIGTDGSLTINGKTYQQTSYEKSAVSNYECYYFEEGYAVTDLDKEFQIVNNGKKYTQLALMKDNVGHGGYVKDDSVKKIILPSSVKGTWLWVNESDEKIGLDPDGQEIRSFTIDDAGNLTVNGKVYPLNEAETRSRQMAGEEYYYFGNMEFFITPNDHYLEYADEDFPWEFTISNEHCYATFGSYRSDVACVDLSLENWQEYFEPSVAYQIRQNAGGEIFGMQYSFVLQPKDGVSVKLMSSTAVSGSISDPVYSIAHIGAQSSYTEEMTDDQRRQYEEVFSSLSFPMSFDTSFQKIEEGDWECFLVMFTEDMVEKDSEGVLIPVMSAYQVEITQIAGTLYYKK